MLRIATTLGLSLTLAACGTIKNSWVNPANWFGASEPAVVQPVELALAAADTRVLIQDVTGLVVEPTSAGAIIRATGVAPQEGWWDAQLVKNRAAAAPGELFLEFRVEAPFDEQPIGTARTREITVATHLSSQELRDLRVITVLGAQGARTIKR